jgi:oxygen-dependent protoporphyrinogen oxidase
LFLSFRNGMETLIQRLGERLPSQWVSLRRRVVGLQRASAPSRWCVRLADGQAITADGVCLAIPTFRAVELVRDIDGVLAQHLSTISYASWITVNLAFRRQDIAHPLNGFGFTVSTSEGLPFAGCTFSHVKFPGRAPEGMALLRVFVTEDGGSTCGQRAAQDPCATVLPALRPILGLRRDPVFAVVHRFPQALPRYAVGHLERVATIRERLRSLPGLVLAGNAYQGHGITHCIRSAEQAAAAVYETLTPRVERTRGA